MYQAVKHWWFVRSSENTVARSTVQNLLVLVLFDQPVLETELAGCGGAALSMTVIASKLITPMHLHASDTCTSDTCLAEHSQRPKLVD